MQLVALLGTRDNPPAALDVSGLTLAQRTLRVAAVTDIARALVVSGEPARWEHLASDHVIAGDVELTHQRTSHEDALAALREARDQLEDEFIVAPGDRVLTPKAVRQLLEEPGPSALLDEDGEVIAARFERDQLEGEDETLRALVARLADAYALTPITSMRPELMRVRDAAQAREAKRRLFKTLRKPFDRQHDGFTAYHLNRPISLSISWLLVHTPIRPNHVTAFDILLGIFAGYLMARGDWTTLALGALLMQLVSIFDGIDGELARVKLLMSPWGERFDSMGDDVIKMATLVGLGVSSFKMFGHEAILWATWTGVGCSLAMMAAWYVELARQGTGTLNGAKWWFEEEGREDNFMQRVYTVWSYLLKRDTYTLILMLIAAINLPHVALALMLVGIAIIFVSTFGQIAVRSLRGAEEFEQPAAE